MDILASHAEDRSDYEQILSQIEAAAQHLPISGPREPFAQFLRHYYDTAAVDTLRLRHPQELAAAAHAHWQFAAQRERGQTRVRVVPPANNGSDGRAPLAVVETCTEDQPFLVDTVTLSVRGAGALIDWSVHPLLRVARDAHGAIAAVGAEEAAAESWIHLEFEPLSSDADYGQLEVEINSVLADLRRVVDDYPDMLTRVRALVEELRQVPSGGNAEDYAEACTFLEYLDNHHFTFLGVVDTHAEADSDGHLHFVADRGSGLGLLRADSLWSDEQLIAPQAELNKYSESPRLIVVIKSGLRSTVHRNELMDIVSVRRVDAEGRTLGTTRLIGLFASEVYNDRPRNIPLIRRKVQHMLQRARLPEQSHSGKNLRDILHQLPRDELFQSSEDELYRLCMGIRALRDRYHLRLFVRRDRYGRFFSCLVYLPRDRYSRELREKIGSLLLELYGGSTLERNVDFLRGSFARVHYVVRTPPGSVAPHRVEEVEARLIAATRSWREQLRDALLHVFPQQAASLLTRFGEAFPLAYQETVAIADAVEDIRMLAQLTPSQPLLPRLFVAPGAESPAAHACPKRLKLYALRQPIILSDVLPVLENFGFTVMRQDPAEIVPHGETSMWVQEFDVSHHGGELPADVQREYFEAAFVQVWQGQVENDGLNQLVLGAGLSARQVTLLRAICKYLIQTGLPFAQPYMESLLIAHAAVARLLVQLFEARFALGLSEDLRRDQTLQYAQALDHALDQVESLDGDRVMRAFLSVVRAATRTNYFQTTREAYPKHYVSIKLDPAKIPELPLPLPQFEIWVYAPEVEGVHLRGGRVARGGLRWSDRRADFRTEVLGLMKAQMVKNTVIVPVGAKGGFVVKGSAPGLRNAGAGRSTAAPPPSDRDAWQANGIECYRTFVRGLLDVTDNRIGAQVVPPPDCVRHDDDDPYLVVAADKGTATFSDIANALALDYGFWLGDAFASGGSAGYDHKKMGITARGAWESVKRHFRELVPPRDIQAEAFTAVGIGDMSGDVFGNGMLLSAQLHLLAAFDHRHIFIDPQPDPQRSFAERQRLFALPRSSWADYDGSLISAGGGVYPRSAKSIRLSAEARAVLDIPQDTLTPAELIRAILKAPVDLLWNGGIGTYVKAATQSNLDVGDRSNDAVRVNGRDLRCKIVGEGGNLGFTQAGRIEYALLGGRINTDAIDNAGGVHTSDREVNIKIPLHQLMLEGSLTHEERDPQLAELTDAVAQAVLRDNYVQSAALSLIEVNALQRLGDHAELMHMLEREGLLNRAIEGLPDDDGLKERRGRGLGLTRPELAVLLAYSKISLYDAVLQSAVPDDPFFVQDLLAYFPAPLVARFGAAFNTHRLKREIVATILSNALVNRMGAGFAQLWAEDHGLTRGEVVKAYATAHRIYGGDRYWAAIEALDNQLPAATQYRLMGYAIGLLKHVTGWLTASKYAEQPVQVAVDRFAAPIAELAALLPTALPPAYREEWRQTEAQLRDEGVPAALAAQLASTRALGAAPDIVDLAADCAQPLAEAAAVYYLVGEKLSMLWLYAAINALTVSNKWQALARVNLRDDAYKLHRHVAARVLHTPGTTPLARWETWSHLHQRHVQGALSRIGELQSASVHEFAALAVAVREIRRLRRL